MNFASVSDDRTSILSLSDRCLYVTLFVGVILFIAIDISGDVKRLTSLGGMAFFIVTGYVASKNPSKVKQFNELNINFISGAARVPDYRGHMDIFA